MVGDNGLRGGEVGLVCHEERCWLEMLLLPRFCIGGCCCRLMLLSMDPWEV